MPYDLVLPSWGEHTPPLPGLEVLFVRDATHTTPLTGLKNQLAFGGIQWRVNRGSNPNPTWIFSLTVVPRQESSQEKAVCSQSSLLLEHPRLVVF